MHITQTFAQFLLMATMAAGLPQPTANEPEAQDIEKRIELSPEGSDPLKWCSQHRPAKDELQLISFVGHYTHFNGQKIGSHASQGWAYLLDQSCSRLVHVAPYEPIGSGAGHKALMGMSYDGAGPEPGWQITIEAIARYLGPNQGAASAIVSINGEKKPSVCTGPKSDRNKLNVNKYSVCNFKPGSVWPKPWWPYGNGYN
ncbi:hypothetical protein GCG54_00003051 [Colletotrichum gloeosporioides]|uniref:Uncharacterized protein n=1 Tax=Colletotrichum gloeosporioides TaxID=474922 RepID=A0A8H4FQI8_COLGL|nr:uncharacterized protein GCG54_00003051 [Colletotrichum gloeosporioides]KAF3810873.1 hypothetical protein GCG54_00003051 [Colletotrichum gloeosporioides]